MLRSNPHHTWTVGELAAASFVSRSSLDDRFRRCLGLSPIRYLAEVRINVAQGLLRTSDLPLRTISRQVGYASEEAFSRAFRRRIGVSPGAWRARRVTRMFDEVADANQAFYDAHETRDFEAMRAVWEHSERVACTHPGWPILRGWVDVEESWRRILGGPGRNQFILTNLGIVHQGDAAWVTVDENLVAGDGTGTVAATNVFVRGADGWKLVLHHGSPVMAR